MKKILITGGAGTVGTSFMRKYPEYEYFNVSRNEENAAELFKEIPNLTNYIADINDYGRLVSIFNKVRPDVVIHAAAMKHVNLAEENPTAAAMSNVIGSLNVIKASVVANVPVTVGISTDKACDPDNVYGYTKRLMEECFFDNSTPQNKFVCTRFANVANSNGSVIPFFKKCAKNGQPLKLTSPDMNRLMFSKFEAAELVHTAITYAEKLDSPFVLSKIMKNVNMLDLAEMFDCEIETVGKRPGEKLNETLISHSEVERTLVNEDGYIVLLKEKTPEESRLNGEHSSVTATNMTTDELKNLIWTNE